MGRHGGGAATAAEKDAHCTSSLASVLCQQACYASRQAVPAAQAAAAADGLGTLHSTSSAAQGGVSGPPPRLLALCRSAQGLLAPLRSAQGLLTVLRSAQGLLPPLRSAQGLLTPLRSAQGLLALLRGCFIKGLFGSSPEVGEGAGLCTPAAAACNSSPLGAGNTGVCSCLSRLLVTQAEHDTTNVGNIGTSLQWIPASPNIRARSSG